MTTSANTEQVFVVGEWPGAHGAAVAAHLRERGLSAAQWVAPRDVADVDRAVRAGRAHAVLFAHLDDALEALWSGEITPDVWLRAGIRIAVLEEASTASDFHAILRVWERWQSQQQRRRIVAGVLLSVLAIAAAWLLLWVTA